MNQRPVDDNKAPLQRLIIVHLKLIETCIGKAADEDVSDAELLEQVLYFSHSEQLLSFVVLCCGLYNLPSSIYNHDTSDDRSQIVELSQSTLLFVELEPDVVAFVQVHNHQSLDQNDHQHVQQSLQNSHLLFRLLRRGGILLRLNDWEKMEQLFALRKKLRRVSDRTIQDEIDLLYESLSITSIRSELRVHYDSFLLEVDILSNEEVFSSQHESTASLNAAVREHFQQIPESLLSLDTVAVFCYKNSGLITHLETQDVSELEALLILQFMLSTGQNSQPQVSPVGKGVMGQTVVENESSIRNGFLSPPLLSALSALDELNAFECDGSYVWLPLVAPTIGTDVTELRACLYVHEQCRVLLYLPVLSDYGGLLMQVQEFLDSSFRLIRSSS